MGQFQAPVFKGCTRSATKLGVPLYLLMGIVFTFLMIGALTTLIASLLMIPVIAAAGALTRSDPQIWRQMGLWIIHRLQHRNPQADKALSAVTYLPYEVKK